MGQVKYFDGIDYVKGSLAKPKTKDGHSCGSYIIGTHREAPTQSKICTRMYLRAANTYERSTPKSTNEVWANTRFAQVAAAVKTRKDDLSKLAADTAAFEAQKNDANGKKTMLAWYWMVEGDAYDQQHPRS